MEQKERMLIEALAGAVLVLFLILGSIVVVHASNGSDIEMKNSYNAYNTYISHDDVKPYIVDSGEYQKTYYVHRDDMYARDSDTPLRYVDSSRERTFRATFGNDVTDYEVYVTNEDYVGGYFKVVYYFTDYYGREQSYAVNNYVPARDEKRFFIRDVSDQYKYQNWHYEVESMTKTPSRVYYGN